MLDGGHDRNHIAEQQASCSSMVQGTSKHCKSRRKADPTAEELQRWSEQVFGRDGMPAATLHPLDGGLTLRPLAKAMQKGVANGDRADAAQVLMAFADEELWIGCLFDKVEDADKALGSAGLPGKRVVCLFENSKTGEVCVRAPCVCMCRSVLVCVCLVLQCVLLNSCFDRTHTNETAEHIIGQS